MSEIDSYDAVVKALRMLKKIRRLEGTVFVHEGVILSADTLFHDSQNEAFVREINALISLYRNSGKVLSRAVLGFDGGNVMLFHAAPFSLALIFGDVAKAAAVEKAGEEFIHKWAASLKIDPSLIGRPVDLDPTLLERLPVKVEPVAKAEEPAVKEMKQEESEDTIPITPAPIAVTEAMVTKKVLPVEEPETVEEAIAPITPPEEITETKPMEEALDKRWKSYRDKVETLFSKVLGRAQATRLIERELVAMGVEEGGYLTSSQFRPFGQKLIKKVKDRTLRKQLENELLSLVETYID